MSRRERGERLTTEKLRWDICSLPTGPVTFAPDVHTAAELVAEHALAEHNLDEQSARQPAA